MKHQSFSSVYICRTLITLLVWFPQAAGVERAAPPAERGAEGSAAAKQQAAAATRADLPALRTGNYSESVFTTVVQGFIFGQLLGN